MNHQSANQTKWQIAHKQRQSKMKIDRFIAFYKRYISPLNPPACRFYPTCSEYAALCFRFDNPATALFKSLMRLLKCNQLFSGGIAYPRIALDTRKFVHNIPRPKAQMPKNIAFWLVPCVDKHFGSLDSKPKFTHLKPKNNAKITHKFFAIKSLKG